MSDNCKLFVKDELVYSSQEEVTYELASGSLIIDDEITHFNKEILSFNVNPNVSGIEVKWSNNDIVVLNGETANISTISFNTELWAVGIATANCSSWISYSQRIGYSSTVPSQTIRNNPATGCPSGTALYQQGVQMGDIQGITNGNSYAQITWQSPPTLELRPILKDLYAVGTVTGNCSTWINNFEISLGKASTIPSQTVRNAPSTGCPSGTILHQQGVQMNTIAGFPTTNSGTTYYLVTWQSAPTLQLRGAANPTGYRVTTNLNETSERITNTSPMITYLEEGCELVVSFADSTQSEPIELSSCDSNIVECLNIIKINEGDIVLTIANCITINDIEQICGNKCPAGTCLAVRCNDNVCCYGNGGIVIAVEFDPNRIYEVDC